MLGQLPRPLRIDLADDGQQVIEIEVKLSKSDLVRGEARKGKHPLGKAGGWPFDTGSQWKGIPNRFYLCVPEGIADAAEEWILKTHPSYGLIVFLEKELWRLERGSVVFWGEALHFRRGAKKLHNEYRDSVWRAICKRASASLCTLMGYRAVQVSKHNEGKV